MILKLPEQPTRYFWYLTAVFILILIVSQLIQDGAFMDGMLYVSVSKNLADGVGTFWDPHFCKTYQSSFHEQPPLYFGVLAVFYKILGTSMYVERLFCFTCFAVTAFFIHKLWRKIFFNADHIAKFSWIPILFWTSIPICFWAYTNFVEETLMSLFAVIAVYFSFMSLFLERRIFCNLLIASLFIFLSSLTKGLQGLFPIICAGAYWLVTRKITFRKALLYSLILISVPFLVYSFLLLKNQAAYESFEKYFNIRLLGTFNVKSATTNDRLFLVEQLFFHLLPITCISLFLVFYSKKNNIQKEFTFNNDQVIKWHTLIGLSGSLPLLITLEQRTWYLVTSLPFFAIAISLIPAQYLSSWYNKININSNGYKIFKSITFVLFLSSIVYAAAQFGNAKRDKNTLADVYTFGKIIPYGSTISIPKPMCFDFSFKEYLIRYFYISSDDSPAEHFYLACRKNLPKNLVPEKYKLYPADTKEFDLYILKP